MRGRMVNATERASNLETIVTKHNPWAVEPAKRLLASDIETQVSPSWVWEKHGLNALEVGPRLRHRWMIG
jgi:hypothetical protein